MSSKCLFTTHMHISSQFMFTPNANTPKVHNFTIVRTVWSHKSGDELITLVRDKITFTTTDIPSTAWPACLNTVNRDLIAGAGGIDTICYDTSTACRLCRLEPLPYGRCCCLHPPMTLASGRESDVPACGPPASFSVHLASSAVTAAGSVHKSMGDNVVRMWVQSKRWCVDVT